MPQDEPPKQDAAHGVGGVRLTHASA